MHLFSARKVDKTYLALVNNLPDPLKGTIDLPLKKKDSPRLTGTPGGPEGRDYEIMAVDPEGQNPSPNTALRTPWPGSSRW